MSKARRILGALAIAALSSGAPVAAQDGLSLDTVFFRLQQLQDANLGIARQMSGLQRQAAAEMMAALDAGRIGEGHREIARTLAGNALTLAAIMLSPMQTYQTAAGESMFVLVRRNIELLGTVQPVAGADPVFEDVLGRYTILQMQTQDLAAALEAGWARYGDIMDEAERTGHLAPRAFDRDTQSWSIGTPVISTDLASLPAATSTADVSQPLSQPAPVAPAEAPPVIDAPALQAFTDTLLGGAQPAVTSEPPANPPGPSAPDPLLTGNPQPLPTPPLATGIVPLQVPALTAPAPGSSPPQLPATNAGNTDRLAATGPLSIADPRAPASPPAAPPPVAPAPTQSGQYGDWALTLAPGGRASANSPNLVLETAVVIRSLEMTCAPDGSVQYVVDASRDFPGFRIYADRSANESVETSGSNVVVGASAQRMADTLQRAYDWARQVPDAGRRLTVRTSDAEGILALFAADGYAEARDAVTAACAGGPTTATETAALDAAPEATEPTELPPGPEGDADPAPVLEPPPEAAAPPQPAVVPPVPRPREARPAPRAIEPAPPSAPAAPNFSGPIDLLGGGAPGGG